MTSSGSSTPSVSSSDDASVAPAQALRDAMEATEKLHDMLAKSHDSSSSSENSDVHSRQLSLVAKEAEEATDRLHELLAVRAVVISSSSEDSSEDKGDAETDNSRASTKLYSEEWDSPPSTPDLLNRVEQQQRSSDDEDWLLSERRNDGRAGHVHTTPPLDDGPISQALSVASSTFVEEWIQNEAEQNQRAQVIAAIPSQDSLTWRPGIDLDEGGDSAEYEESVADDLSPKSSLGRLNDERGGLHSLKTVVPSKGGHGDTHNPVQWNRRFISAEAGHLPEEESPLVKVDHRAPENLTRPPDPQLQSSTCEISVQVGSMYDKGCQVTFDEATKILYDTSQLRPSLRKPLEAVKTGEGWSMLSELLVTLEKYSSYDSLHQNTTQESMPQPGRGISHCEEKGKMDPAKEKIVPLEGAGGVSMHQPSSRVGATQGTGCSMGGLTDAESTPLVSSEKATHLELDMVTQGGKNFSDLAANITIGNMHRQELTNIKHVLKMIKSSGGAGPRGYTESAASRLTLLSTLAYIDAHKPYKEERSGLRHSSGR